MAYGHHFRKIAPDHFRLERTIDRKYAGSRLRYPTNFTRDTDEAGAIRFAVRWNIRPPEPEQKHDDHR